MARFSNFICFILGLSVLVLSVDSSENIQSVEPFNEKFRQCTFGKALDCFIYGYFKVSCITKLEKQKAAEIFETNKPLTSLIFTTFNNCVSKRLKSVTTSDENELVVFISNEEMGDFEKQKTFFNIYVETSLKSDDILTLKKGCQTSATLYCLSKANCFIKSHYTTIIEVMHECQNETSEIIKKASDRFENPEIETKLLKKELIPLPKSEPTKPSFSSATLDSRNFYSYKNEEEKILNSIGYLTIDQLKNLKKYGQIYLDFKKLICG